MTTSLVTLGAVLGLCVGSACGGIAVIDATDAAGGAGGNGSGGTGQGGTGGNGSGGTGQGAAACFDPVMVDEAQDPPFTECQLLTLCDTLLVNNPAVAQPTFNPPEAADCILSALRDRAQGQFFMIVQSGSEEQYLQSWLLGDEFGGHEVFSVPGPDAPLPVQFRRSKRLRLKSQQTFQDCLDNPVLGQQLAFCLQEWWTSCTDDAITCTP